MVAVLLVQSGGVDDGSFHAVADEAPVATSSVLACSCGHPLGTATGKSFIEKHSDMALNQRRVDLPVLPEPVSALVQTLRNPHGYSFDVATVDIEPLDVIIDSSAHPDSSW